jgi:glucosyltransferase
MEKISVVVSCYNEEESIPLFYNEIKKVMSIMKEFQFEVLFVDDGSKDRTLEVAKELAKKDECKVCVIFQKFWERSSDVCGIKLCFWRVCHNHGCGFTRSAKSVA